MKWITIEKDFSNLPKDGEEYLFDEEGEAPVWARVKWNGKHPCLLVHDSSGEEEYLPIGNYHRFLDETPEQIDPSPVLGDEAKVLGALMSGFQYGHGKNNPVPFIDRMAAGEFDELCKIWKVSPLPPSGQEAIELEKFVNAAKIYFGKAHPFRMDEDEHDAYANMRKMFNQLFINKK